MELALLDIWSFGKVHKIRKPALSVAASTSMAVIPKNVVTPSNVPVITGNVPKTVPCSIPVKRIRNTKRQVKKDTSSKDVSTKRTSRSMSYDMHPHPLPKKVTQRTSGRKRVNVDYSQFDVTSDDTPSPKKKKRTVDLKRKPSAAQIAADKFKTKPANTPRPLRARSTTRVLVMTTVAPNVQISAIASTSCTITTPAT